MADLLQRSLGPHFTLNLPDANMVAIANVDENQLEMALLNLIVNARDAMPSGGPIKINVMTRYNELEVGQIAIEVVDDGAGMDSETLARATEPFFTTKGPTKGTGLGLSMVHGFALQSGGELIVNSTLGEGTKATILLPIGQAINWLEPAGLAEEQPTSLQTSPVRILAVDDDVLVLMNTQAMLEDLGHSVVTALNGESALQILDQTEEIDLVVTDHAMPKMTGLQLAAAINVRRPRLPIILATGYAELTGDQSMIAVKLDKPFMQTQLEQAVAQALSGYGRSFVGTHR